MTEPNVYDISQEESIKVEVSSEFEEAKNFAKTVSIDDIRNGQWFIKLLVKVMQSYNRNARAEYFQQKYPGLHPDEIADILNAVTVKYAAITGAVAGAAVTANQITTLSSAGMTMPLMVSVIGGEMIYLAKLQLRLVLDLAVVYDLQLDPNDPEDILMIFGYAVGVAPTELLGKGVNFAAREGTKRAIKKYISKGVLKFIQELGRKIGIKILQRTIIKYTIPIVSAVIGSGYNYVTTKSVGKIAKAHLKNRGKVTDELRVLVSRQNTYSIVFPAAAMYIAQIDGQLSDKEQEFYRALLSRMSFEEHSPVEFQKMIASEVNILDAIAKLEAEDIGESLVEVLTLMAIYDGELSEEERAFLIKVANQLDVPLDLAELEDRLKDYQISLDKTVFQKTTSAAKGITTTVGGKAAGIFSKIRRKPDLA